MFFSLSLHHSLFSGLIKVIHKSQEKTAPEPPSTPPLFGLVGDEISENREEEEVHQASQWEHETQFWW